MNTAAWKLWSPEAWRWCRTCGEHTQHVLVDHKWVCPCQLKQTSHSIANVEKEERIEDR